MAVPSCALAPSPFRIFQFDSLDVRLSDRDGEPWFVLADVCCVLEIGNAPQAASRLDGDEKTTITTSDSRSGHGAQSLNIINESGLYSLILTSRKPAAKRFKKWVTSQVLPAIRKTGSYAVPAAAPTPADARFERILTLAEKLVEALAITAVSITAERRSSPLLAPSRASRKIRKVKGEEYLRVKDIVRTTTGGRKIRHAELVSIGHKIGKFCNGAGHETLLFQNRRIYPRSTVEAWLDQGGRDLILSSAEENADV